jgi:hypothetical protein
MKELVREILKHVQELDGMLNVLTELTIHGDEELTEAANEVRNDIIEEEELL